jgi:protein-S-isoprenylcysteine O-methyltransferase Ste14
MTPASPLQRTAVLIYGVLCYLIFFATFLYLIAFVGGYFIPRSLDSAPVRPLGVALLVNAALVLIFGLQHSVMARPAFKRRITAVIPAAAERSTFVLASSLALMVLFRFWQPMGGTIWAVQNSIGRGLLLAGSAFGWLTVLGTTLVINHFDLFGLRQVWKFFRGVTYMPIKFVTPGPYRRVRHPLYVGFLLAFWCAPTMTVAHLVFALLNTAYILTAIRFEERDLATHLGADYVAYQKSTPMIIPRLSGGK